MAIELETLEVVIDANVEKIEQQMKRVTPIVERAMKMIGMSTEKATDKVEQGMDISEGSSKMEKQMAQLNDHLKKQMEFMEKQTEKSSANIGSGMAKGIKKGSKTVSKDIDAMVEEINAKMGQAKAAQEKVAFLKTQRQGAVRNNDKGKEVKFDTQIATAQAQATKFEEAAKGLARGMRTEYDATGDSLDKIARKMTENEQRIEPMRSRIRAMQKEYENAKVPTGSFSKGFNGTEDTEQSLKIQDKISAQQAKMNKLVADNDALQQAYAATEDRARLLEPALERLNTTFGRQSRQTDAAGSGIRRFGRLTEGSRGLMSRLGNVVGRFGNAARNGFSNASQHAKNYGSVMRKVTSSSDKGLARNRKGMFTLGTQMKMVMRTLVFYVLIMKGIQALGQSLWQTLQTNEQFNASLNQIKVNLLTAFYPIYQAALPAINALMGALSKATAYIAAFIATLFGTTYTAAKQGASGLYKGAQAIQDTGSKASQGAQGLQKSAQAMKATGTQATKAKEKVKQLQRSLMGFDEINNLSTQKDDDNLDPDDTKDNTKLPKTPNTAQQGTNFNTPTPAIPGWIADWANKLKKIWKDFFAPIKAAWDAQGKRVMDAFKYSLRECLALAKAIGKSFMEVWTNGTGQRFVENLLILLGDVLYIIGDIAKAFRIAWNDGGRGTKYIQSIFDVLNAILELLHSVAKSFRQAWNDERGVRISKAILDLLTHIHETLTDVIKSLQYAWDESDRGVKLWSAFLDLFAELLEFADVLVVSFDNAWNSSNRGHKIWANILEIMTNIFNIAGNLVGSLKRAWQENEVGKRLFQDILDIINVSLDAINDATAYTTEWAKKLDFTPLLESIDKLLKSIEPLTKNVFDGLSWAWKNVFLPLAGFTIEDLLPAFLEALGGAIDFVNGVIEGLKPAFKWFWDSFLQPIAEWTGGVIVKVLKGIGKALKTIGDWIDEHSEGFSDFVVVFVTFVGAIKAITLIQTAVGVISGLFAGLSAIGGLSGLLTAVGGAIGGIVTVLGGPLVVGAAAAIAVGVLLYKNWDKIKKAAGKLAGAISEKWEEIKKATSEKWASIKETTSEAWENVRKTISTKTANAKKTVADNWQDIKKSTSEKWSQIKTNTSTAWENVRKTISDKTNESKKKVSDNWQSLKKNTSEKWSQIKTNTSSTWGSIKDKISTKSSQAKNNAASAFSSMRSKVSGSVNGLKNTVSSVFSSIGKGARDLPGKIASGLKGGVGKIKEASKKIGGGMLEHIHGAVNGVIKGIKWVLNKVGASGTAKKLGSWAMPKYAKGTNYHPGGVAMVNDAPGVNYQEAYQSPTGEVGLFPRKRNMLVDLPRGYSVLNGARTAREVIPHYAGGIGKWIKDKWDFAKEKVSDVWSYVKNPGKLLDIGIGKMVNLSGVTQPTKDIAKGAVGTIADSAKNWFAKIYKKKYDEQNSFGTGSRGEFIKLVLAQKGKQYVWGATGPNTFDCSGLIMWALSKLGISFPHYTGAQWGATKHISEKDAMPGDLIYFGPGASRHVGMYTKKGQMFNAASPNAFGPGKGLGYSPYRAPDLLGFARIKQLSGKGGSGGGGPQPSGSHKNWMRLAGFKPADFAAINYIVKRESGWNYRATNASSGAYGLPQSLPGSKMASAGGDWRSNPITQLRWMKGYVNGRYGGANRALAFWQRNHWYANGGWVNNDGIYRMGEGNKKELVLPMERPLRALELIQEALQYLGIDWSNDQVTMPETFETSSFTQPQQNFAQEQGTRYEGGGIQQGFEGMINSLLMMVKNMGGSTQQANNGDIVINLGGKEFGRIAVAEINKYHAQLGHTELNL